MNKTFKKILALMLGLVTLLSTMPLSVFAAYDYAHNEAESSDDYYDIISKKDWDIAPGIKETEIVLNNETGDRRQVIHLMEADISNPYTRVISSYTNMDTSNYAISTIPEHAAYIENVWGENVVGAMNTCLSWYNSAAYAQDPSRINEPLGFMMVDSEVYFDHSVGFPTCIVIHKDVNEDGEPRPDNIPKVEMRTVTDKSCLNGWEDQVIPCSSGYIVKDGVNQHKASHGSDTAARSVVGVKADGSIVIMMNDGRQSPYSLGMNMYECAEVMIAAGCVYAANCDGGGSSTFMSQRPGEDLAVNCSPCDGALRQNTHGIIFISTAPATGEFDNAYMKTENDYYVPNSIVEIETVGRDFSGAEAEIPADATWALTDTSFGSVANGVFTSNGKIGDATVQMIYNDKVVGSKTIHIVNPESVSFAQDSTVIPYGKSISLEIVATYGEFNVGFNAADFTWTVSDATAGTLDGLIYTATEDESKTGTKVTATYKYADLGSTVLDIKFGKGSEVMWDFEDGDVSNWMGQEQVREWLATNGITESGLFPGGNYSEDNSTRTFLSSVANGGQVKKGQYALGLEVDYSYSRFSEWSYTVLFNVEGQTVLRDVANGKNATKLGMWVYIPEGLMTGSDMKGLAMQYQLYGGTDADHVSSFGGHLLTKDGKNLLNLTEADIPEDRWVYFYIDLTSKDYVSLQDPTKQIWREPSFIRFYTQHYTPKNLVFYFDELTLDYSDAVDDRDAPVISNVTVNTVGNNKRSFNASVADFVASNASGLNYNSAKIYVDGVALPGVSAANGTISSPEIDFTNGTHTVTFEITDNMGNTTKESQTFTIAGTAPVTLGGHNDLNNLLEYDSVYYVDINVADIQTISELTAVLDLNTAHKWEDAYFIVAEGFTATTSVNKYANTVTITVTKTGKCSLTGAQTLVSIPTRVWSWRDTSVYTKDEIFATGLCPIVPYNAKVVSGTVSFVDGVNTDYVGTFSGSISATTNLNDNKVEWHDHTPVALADKAVTCLTDGYTNRTYCDVCGSVVNWGTMVPATGHSYEVVDGKLTCVNGGEVFNGVYTDGKTYVDGVAMADGWTADNTSYYKDGVKLTGSHFMDGVMYTFDNNGIYLPTYKYEGFYEIGDTIMYFIANKYQTGYNKIEGKYYYFHNDGMAWDGKYVIHGITCEFDNGISVPSDTVLLAGMCGEDAYFVITTQGAMYVEGTGFTYDYLSIGNIPWYVADYRNNIKTLWIGKDITGLGVRAFYNIKTLQTVTFEAGSALKAIKGRAFMYCQSLKNVVLPESLQSMFAEVFMNCYSLSRITIPETTKYILDNAFTNSTNVCFYVRENSYAYDYATKHGFKIEINNTLDPNLKQGVQLDEDGEIRYYVNGVAQYAGLVQDTDGSYYYFGNSKTAKRNCYYGISKTNGLLPSGGYTFGADGKIILPKNGIVKDADGEIRYYIDDVAQYAGLVQDADGNYYYFGSNKKAKRDCYYGISKTNGLLPSGGYWFGEDGKLSFVNPNLKQGIHLDDDGEIRYYIDGVAQYAGLVQDADGNYYYFGSNKKAKRDCYYGISKTNGLLPSGGYTFGADGKIVMPKNGIVKDADGEIRYYIDGVAQYAGLVQDTDGSYYYFGNSKTAKRNCYYGISKTNGLLPSGGYTFDADGKIVF